VHEFPNVLFLFLYLAGIPLSKLIVFARAERNQAFITTTFLPTLAGEKGQTKKYKREYKRININRFRESIY